MRHLEKLFEPMLWRMKLNTSKYSALPLNLLIPTPGCVQRIEPYVEDYYLKGQWTVKMTSGQPPVMLALPFIEDRYALPHFLFKR